MDLGSLRALALDLNFAAHGVPVTVQPPDSDEIETRGIWVTPISEDVPIGSEFSRREPQRVMALSRLAVPSVPKGTVIQAPEKSGDEIAVWRVDGLERKDADHHRVIVIPEP